MGSLLRAIAAWSFTGIYWPVVLVTYLTFFRFFENRFLMVVSHFWGKTVLSILSIQLRLENSSTIADRKARVVICNHQSALDLVWGAAVCPPSILAIGKKEVIFVPVLNLIWWALDFIRIDRKNREKALASLAGVGREILKNQRSLWLAPEGTRTLDGSILPFKKGAFHIAISNRVPIYPVVVSGAYELFPKYAIFPRTGLIRIRFLPPIETSDLSLDNMTALIDRIRQNMIQAYQEMQHEHS